MGVCVGEVVEAKCVIVGDDVKCECVILAFGSDDVKCGSVYVEV